ncbi:hypothetical protein QX776_05820 [Alteromonadaceae bacterium BrNp21-10]|nr:hypothetical protein [Alteromonadaceae bacterium BrNp21-10]
MTNHPSSKSEYSLEIYNWTEAHAGWLALACYSISGTYILIIPQVNYSITSVLLLFCAAFTILVFTRPIDYEDKGADQDHDNQPDAVSEKNYVINAIFRIAYGFILLWVFVIYVLLDLNNPLVLDSIQQQSSQKGLNQLHSRHSPMLAIVRGCDYQFQPRDAEVDNNPRTLRLAGKMPIEAECGDMPPQWVLSIGGNILACHLLNNCVEIIFNSFNKQDRHNPSELNKHKSSLEMVENEHAQNQKKLTSKQYFLQGIETELHIFQTTTLLTKNNTVKAEILFLKDLIKKSELEIKNKKKIIIDEEIRLKEINNYPNSNYLIGTPITGGVVIPLYFLILSIIGAMINMARKIPEFQRRVTASYHQHYQTWKKENDKLLPPMTGSAARESIIFQIIQVLSAPGIAIIAYSWAKPEAIGANVLLAFAAGFSSEMFLISVRGVVERLMQNGTRTTPLSKGDENKSDITEPNKVTPSTAIIQEPPLLVPKVSLNFKPKDKVSLIKAVTLENGNIIGIGKHGEILRIKDGKLTVQFSLEKDQDPVIIEQDTSYFRYLDPFSSDTDQIKG